MTTTETFIVDGDRYHFDFKQCTIQKGFAQIDTKQDAWYYGTWANPFEKKIVSYCEGDVTIKHCDSPQEFVAEIRTIQKWNDECGFGPIGIDPGFSSALEKEFVALGLLDLLH